MTRLGRSLVGAVVGFLLFAGLSFVGAQLYYRFMPGSWFIDYYYVKVDDSTVDSDVQATLCRKVRAANLRIDATRYFFLRNAGGQFNPEGEYRFNAGIEQLDNTNCQPVRITAADHPDRAGTYKFATEASFRVNGYEKHIRYESNEYKITETQQSLQDRIDDLQRQIDELKAKQEDTAAVGPTYVAPPPGTDAKTTQPLTPAVATPPAPVPASVDDGLLPDWIPILGPLL